MAFWNKNKLPAEFKDLTEDQITEQLLAGKAATEEAAAAKKRADDAAAALALKDTELTTTKSKLTEYERKMAEAGEGGNREQNQNQNQNQGPPDTADWITNPSDAFNRMSAPTNAIALHGAMMSASLVADDYIRQQGPVNARLWRKYKDEVAKIVQGYNPQAQILPKTWVDAFTYVKGLHTDDIVKEGQTAGDAFFSESAATTGAGLNANTVDADKKRNEPDDHDKRMALRYGVPIERYMKTKNSMTFERG